MTPVACRAKMVAVELRENDLLQNLTATTLPVAVGLWENDLLRHLTVITYHGMTSQREHGCRELPLSRPGLELLERLEGCRGAVDRWKTTPVCYLTARRDITRPIQPQESNTRPN